MVQSAAPSSERLALAGAGLLGSGALVLGERLLAAVSVSMPGDPEVPNEEVAKILKDLFGDRPIRHGPHLPGYAGRRGGRPDRAGDHREHAAR